MGKSYQRGWVVSRGKKWYGYFRKTVFDPTTNQQKSDVISVVLGLKSHMKASEAREVLEREITKQTGQSGANAGRVMNDSSVTFGWFVRNRFFPLKEAHWKEETAKVKKLLIQRDLIDPFDKTPLENLDKFTLQVHLNNLAKTNSKDRVLQIRAYLRDIFAEAVDQDFLVKDPARKVTVPTQLRDTDRTTLTWLQLRRALSKLDLRDRVLLELDMTNALRPGELFALRWQCFSHTECTMRLVETVYKGKIRPWGKTRKSLGSVHVPKELADDLWLWKQRCPDPSPSSRLTGSRTRSSPARPRRERSSSAPRSTPRSASSSAPTASRPTTPRSRTPHRQPGRFVRLRHGLAGIPAARQPDCGRRLHRAASGAGHEH